MTLRHSYRNISSRVHHNSSFDLFQRLLLAWFFFQYFIYIFFFYKVFPSRIFFLPRDFTSSRFFLRDCFFKIFFLVFLSPRWFPLKTLVGLQLHKSKMREARNRKNDWQLGVPVYPRVSGQIASNLQAPVTEELRKKRPTRFSDPTRGTWRINLENLMLIRTAETPA